MKHIYTTLILFVMCVANAYSQSVMIRGTVRGNDGDLLGGVTITLETPKRVLGTTATNGTFLVSAPENGTLIFNSQGFSSKKLKLNSGVTSYEIILVADTKEIEEVVIGYQARKTTTITGSAVTISHKDIQDAPVGNVMELLQGKVAGLNIQNNTGSPGQRGTINIRGISNINVSGSGDNAFLTPTSPLFVIDGVPIDDNTGYEYGFQTAGPNITPLSMIPPEDIESIVVLKDAQATALYGSRGAYGVMLITTRRGNSKIPIVQYTGQTFLNTVPTLRDIYGGKDERLMRIEQIIRYDTTYNMALKRINSSPLLADSLNAYYNNSTNWQSYFYRNTINNKHNINIAGGDASFNYKVNSEYYDEKGIIQNTGFKRYTVQSNMQYQPNEKFRLMANVNSYLAKNSMGSGNATTQTGIGSSANTTSLFPSPSIYGGSSSALSALNINDDNKTGYYVGQAELQYEPITGLRGSSTINYNYTMATKDRFTPEMLNGNNSEVYAYNDRRNRIYNRNMISYIKSWDEGNHTVNIYGFSEMEIQKYQADLHVVQGTANDQFQTGLSYNTRYSKGGTLNNVLNFRSLAYAANLTYNFKEKYILEAMYRVDGTSTTGGASPWSYNPSIGLRWNAKKEKFLDNVDFVDDLFFRGSWGRNITPTGSISDLYGWYRIDASRYNNGVSTSLNLQNAPNINLLPQTSTQWSGAVELGILDRRLYFVYETYYKQVDQQLRRKLIANHNAFEGVFTNETSVVNYGHEGTISYRPQISNSDWTANFGLNFGINKDITSSLPDGVRQILETDNSNSNLPTYYRLGRNSMTFVLYNYEGVYLNDEDVPVNPNTGLRYRAGGVLNEGRFFRAGDPIFTDINGDYILDEKDLVYVGNSQPRVTGGFNTFVQFKNWALTTQFSFTLKRDVLNVAMADRFRNYANPVNGNGAYIPLDMYNVWEQVGDVADYPNVSDFTRWNLYDPYRYNSTLWLEDGSYLKFNQATLSYNFDRKWSQRFGVSSARIYLTGYNLYSFNRYSGPDPELVTAVGRDISGGYPNRRSYTLGLNIQF